MTPRGAIFDLGGVVLGSPFEAIARYEQEHAIAAGFVSRLIAQGSERSAFHALERGEIDTSAFAPRFEAEAAALGVKLDGKALISAIARAAKPRPVFLRAIEIIRGKGIKTCALTNNWKGDSTAALHSHFDVFLESSKLGMRKPDPRIYRLACEALGLAEWQVVYLDDIGANLKPARALGLLTIKVDAPDTALAELEKLLGFSLA